MKNIKNSIIRKYNGCKAMVAISGIFTTFSMLLLILQLTSVIMISRNGSLVVCLLLTASALTLILKWWDLDDLRKIIDDIKELEKENEV